MTPSDARGPRPVKKANPADYSQYFSAPAPEMVPVISTNIRAFGWTEVEPRVGALVVTFASGATYRYAPVPRQVFDLLLVAESKGGTFNDLVKRGPYAAVRIARLSVNDEQRIQALARALTVDAMMHWTLPEVIGALRGLVGECLSEAR